jgi:hypothetical protein
MTTCTIKIRPDGAAQRLGIDDGGEFKCQVLAHRIRDDGDAWIEYLALKVPGGSFWLERGRRGYASPKVVVYEVVEKDKSTYGVNPGVTTVKAKEVLSWDTGRKKP